MGHKIIRALQIAVCAAVLFVLRRALDVLYRRDTRVKRELSALGEGFILLLTTGACGPSLRVRLQDGRVRPVKNGEADVHIAVKNVDAAFLLLTGQTGVAQAYAQHRFALRGDIVRTMPIVRCVDIAEGYLFPWVWARRILRRRPGKEMPSALLYLRVLCPFL